MARPRRDGRKPQQPNRRRLTELYVKRVAAEAEVFNVTDTDHHACGLVLRVYPTGTRSYKLPYRHMGRPRWYTIGDAKKMALSEARIIANEQWHRVAKDGIDIVAEMKAERGKDTFGELADNFLLYQRHKKKNKAWAQGRRYIERFALPKWGKVKASTITQADVEILSDQMDSPNTARQFLSHLSAVFNYGVRKQILAVNPCVGIDRVKGSSRETTLADSDLPRFWAACERRGIAGMALLTILLTGQRPGEVCHMRREHFVDGRWQLPGEVQMIGDRVSWPGTKNKCTNEVWLSEPVRSIIAELSDDENRVSGFVFPGPRGAPITDLDATMRDICSELGFAKPVKPHDLRRTFLTKVTKLRFGRDAMNRIANHVEKGVTDVYDRNTYYDEDRNIMEKVAAHIVALAEGETPATNVVHFSR
jgi:integrase